MEMLGLESQCIDAVRSLYKGATTTILVNGHETAPVLIERGTLQGDSLSPLLFIIAIEPLLRWLHSGGRGYTLGSDTGVSIAANAYADDLGAFSDCPKHLAVQAQKIEHFSEWAGLRPNVGKCAVTGILHKYAEIDGSHNPLAPSMLTMLEHRLKGVTLNGKHPKFLHPHEQPFRYSGVELTMTLNWKFQLEAVKHMLQAQASKLNTSMLLPRQKLTYIHNCIRPAVTYAFPVSPYDVKGIQMLDNKMAAIAKQVQRLPRGFPNGMVLESKERAGMGVGSLFVNYGQLSAAHLTRCFNDEGPLGQSTEALYVWQHQQCHGHAAIALEQTALSKALDDGMKDFNILRQLSLTESLGVQVTGPSIIGDLQCSLLHEELTEYYRQTYPGGTKMPKCLGRIFYLAQLGISHMTELFEELRGSLHIMEASQFTARWPHANEAHIHLLHQLIIFLAQGLDKPTKRKRSMPEASRQIVNAQFWDYRPSEPHNSHEAQQGSVEVSKTPKAAKLLKHRYKLALAAAKKSAKSRATTKEQNYSSNMAKKQDKRPTLGIRRSARIKKSLSARAQTAVVQHLQNRKQLEDRKLDTLQSFKEWCLGLSSKKADLVAAYGEEDEIVEILLEAKDEDGTLWYEVRYSAAYMPERHMEILMAMGYQPEYAAIRLDMTPTYPWDLHMLEVRWKPSMKLATTVEKVPESAALQLIIC